MNRGFKAVICHGDDMPIAGSERVGMTQHLIAGGLLCVPCLLHLGIAR